MLGVTKPTLYAYVSRGIVGRSTAADGRTSLYAREEIQQLAGRARRRESAPATIDVQISSAITELQDEGCRTAGTTRRDWPPPLLRTGRGTAVGWGARATRASVAGRSRLAGAMSERARDSEAGAGAIARLTLAATTLAEDSADDDAPPRPAGCWRSRRACSAAPSTVTSRHGCRGVPAAAVARAGGRRLTCARAARRPRIGDEHARRPRGVLGARRPVRGDRRRTVRRRRPTARHGEHARGGVARRGVG